MDFVTLIVLTIYKSSFNSFVILKCKQYFSNKFSCFNKLVALNVFSFVKTNKNSPHVIKNLLFNACFIT